MGAFQNVGYKEGGNKEVVKKIIPFFCHTPEISNINHLLGLEKSHFKKKYYLCRLFFILN
jgi:hypothetical protein